MTARPREFPGEDRQTHGLAPENFNSEQSDTAAQAQTLADEALAGTPGDFGLSDSEKVPHGDDSDDAQDLVDIMRQMESSGTISMAAYRGERNDDDEDGTLGQGAEE